MITIDREAITADTYVATQTYVMDGFTSTAPELATASLLGVAGLAVLCQRRSIVCTTTKRPRTFMKLG